MVNLVASLVTFVISLVIVFDVGMIIADSVRTKTIPPATSIILLLYMWLYIGLISTLDFLGTPEYRVVLHIAALISTLSLVGGYVVRTYKTPVEEESDVSEEAQ